MRVLYLMGKAPLPTNSGDAHRNAALLRATRDVADRLDLVALPQPPGPGVADGLTELRQLCDAVTIVGRSPGEHLGNRVNRVRTLAGRAYYRSIGDDPDVRTAVHGRLAAEPFDVIVLSQPFLASAVPDEHLRKVVYDSHNVHHLRMAESLASSRVLPGVLRERVVRGVMKQESTLVKRAAVCVACSEVDAAAFREISPGARVEVVANGVDVPDELSSPGTGAPLFLASLDASANIEALAFLIEQVLPHLPPAMTIDVAGSNARPAVHRLLDAAGTRTRFLGQVPDAPAAMRSASMLLIPLLSGGGTRLKALEAFAVGAPVVSTAKGVEGIPVESGQHAMIENGPAGFAAAMVRLAVDRTTAARLAEAARELVEKQFTWSALGDEFTGILRSV